LAAQAAQDKRAKPGLWVRQHKRDKKEMEAEMVKVENKD